MVKTGLIQCAQVARQVAEAALPRYLSRHSKYPRAQPTLLALLCVMCHADLTFRETEMHLAEHAELRNALGLAWMPNHTVPCRCVCRLKVRSFDQFLARTLKQVSASAPSNSPPVTPLSSTTVDATGLTSGAMSAFFLNRVHVRSGGFVWRHFGQMGGRRGASPTADGPARPPQQ
jgi:hypothetical protein